MSTSNPQRIKIPNLPAGAVVDENGRWTPEATAFFNQLLVTLQYIISPEGINVPTVDVNNLYLLTTPGTLVYGSDNTLKINLNGVFHQVTTS